MPRYLRLSCPIEDIQNRYDVVVVGSGYGGGIAACRLARAGKRVCLLERGKERQPGEFPENDVEASEQLQIDTPEGHVGPKTGLYDLRLNPDINVFVGCGLGGTSLVNANVSMRADPRVFADPRWPEALRRDVEETQNDSSLEKGYARAEAMLRPSELPQEVRLTKLLAHEKSAAALGGRLKRTRVNVTFEAGAGDQNHVGVHQPGCNLCGDCVSGCNHGSKNTTLMNYLPDAAQHGAEIYTEVDVRRVSRGLDGKWHVHYRITGAHRELFDAPEQFLSADVVVLAAGTLGSTEILLRSRALGLSASDELGARFTGNGDVLGFGYNCDELINGIGAGHRKARHTGADVGPCITGVIELKDEQDVDRSMIVEEGSLPGPLGGILPAALSAAAALVGVDTDAGLRDFARESARELESKLLGPYHGALQNTQTYLLMTHEKTSGRLLLSEDRLRVDWPRVGDEPIFGEADARLRAATRALGGTYVKNPIWADSFKHHLITVHPLGGCVMGDRAETGVVNHKGQVFSGLTGTDVYAGLYVSDGAIVPRPLGCNPLLTISALAERNCALLAADRGWNIDYAPSARAPRAERMQPVGIEFTEHMQGHFSTSVLEDYRDAEADGKKHDCRFEFTLTIVARDLDLLVNDETYEAHMVGTVRAPSLSKEPLVVHNGRFNLLVKDPERIGGKNMRYRMQLRSVEGNDYWFEGTKYIADDPGLDLWPDTTTLYISVREGAGPGGKLVGRGILHILPADFLKQLRATRPVNAEDTVTGLAAVARFGSYFAGSLWEVYGGVFSKPTVFKIGAPPRKKRLLRVPAPQIHPFTTRDGSQLRLTRYEGGTKGPVLLAHGLGVSSTIFSIDTIETNLLEYLVAHGYDAWLLDFRSSIALDAHRTRYTGDDIAEQDFPDAVATVRRLTGKRDIQVLAHCFGATTFTMAMLAGLEGVRSSVISQISTHVYTPPETRLKTGLHVPGFLRRLGVESLTAYVDDHADWQERLFDSALALYPIELEERCHDASCRRITFLYAPLYEHDQLNTATHDALHEMFGQASIGAFEHLARLSNAEHLVGADGSERYMGKLQRLAIPTLFIHGAENGCFLPKSTEDTLAALTEVNGPTWYKRRVIPNYGHIDCIFGKNAAHDVFPHMLEHLEATQ
jgi:cholesterol oxidase